MSYPPPPWELKGTAALLLQTVDARTARHFVPMELDVVRVLPGKTLGGLYVASYGQGSALEYDELIVFSGLTRYGSRLGFWVSHIYVDDPDSVAGGQEIWGLPKERARFEWRETGPELDVRIEHAQKPLCHVRFHRRLKLWRQPFFAPLLSVRGSRILHTTNSGAARLHYATGEADVPAGSPFSMLQLGSSYLAAHLRDMRLVVRAPEVIGRAVPADMPT